MERPQNFAYAFGLQWTDRSPISAKIKKDIEKGFEINDMPNNYMFLKCFNPVFIFGHLCVGLVDLLAEPRVVTMTVNNFS